MTFEDQKGKGRGSRQTPGRNVQEKREDEVKTLVFTGQPEEGRR